MPASSTAASALSSVALFLPRVAYEACANLYAARWSVLPWALFWFCAQALVEASLPALFPWLVRPLSPRGCAAGGPAARAGAARDFRTKVLATGMAIYVVAAASIGFADADTAALREDP